MQQEAAVFEKPQPIRSQLRGQARKINMDDKELMEKSVSLVSDSQVNEMFSQIFLIFY